MAELIEAVASWQNLLMVLLVFGFAPGFVLRLLVRIYPKDDPRRADLVAELYAVSRVEQPLFVAEQLATVLIEGVPHRIKALFQSTRSTMDQDNHTAPGPPEPLDQSATAALDFTMLKEWVTGIMSSGSAHHVKISWWDGQAHSLCGETFAAGTFRERLLEGGVTCNECRAKGSGSTGTAPGF